MIGLCVQKLFEDKNYIDGLSEGSFCEMLTVAMTKSYLIMIIIDNTNMPAWV